MSNSESSVSDDENWGEDAEIQDEVSLEASPLLSPYVKLPSVEDACAHDMESFKFDLRSVGLQRGLDFYGVARLVNWLRTRVDSLAPTAEAPLSPEVVQALVLESADIDINDDSLLKPFDPADPFLHCLDRFAVDDDDDDSDDDDNERNERSRDDSGIRMAAPATEHSSQNQVRHLQEQLAATQNQLALATAQLTANVDNAATFSTSNAAADKTPGVMPADQTELTESTENASAAVDDDYYFTSYSNVYMHEIMLRDAARTGAYQRAISMQSSSVFKDAVIVDVGCGTGILSIFAAQAGASKVIAA
jgi:protein arginine N-methyltransferase 3